MKYFLPFTASFLLIAACRKNDKTTAPQTPAGNSQYAITSVEGYVVRTEALTENITAGGTILPAEETELHPEASGRVVAINLPEGKMVRKGELLLKIFDDDLKTQLQKLETQLKQANITEQRLAELLKVKGVSQQEYDLAALQVQTLKSEIDLARINLAKTELRAPYDGVLGLRRISPGAYVTPGTVVTNIRAVNALKLDFYVPERYGADLKTGQAVSFRVEGEQEAYHAVIQATEQSISAENRNLLVRAMVKNGGKNLLPGAFAAVSLNLGSNPKAIMIPNQAVIPQARDKKVIVSKNGKAQFVTVKTGVRQAEMIEITEGLQAGDTIATTGILFLKPNAAVKFSTVE